MNFVEIVVAVFLVSISLIPIFLSFSSSSQIVSIGIEDFESINTISEIQEQVQQYPFAIVNQKIGSLGDTVIYTKQGKKLVKEVGGIPELELYISPPQRSCNKINIKFLKMGSANDRVLFLIFYEFTGKKGSKKKPRKIVVPGVITK
ncbi:hypothetical protein ACFL35_08960 [Candidatus Riflebacteria bacterium]